jgi:hypothetical protein
MLIEKKNDSVFFNPKSAIRIPQLAERLCE